MNSVQNGSLVALQIRVPDRRVIMEDWCDREVYCPACSSDCLLPSKINTPAIDFTCPECAQPFQLKSRRNCNPKKIVDAGYDSIIRSIRADRVPNLLILQYSTDWFVQNLIRVRTFVDISVVSA